MAALDDFLLGGDWFSGADGRTGDFMSMVERFTRAIELLEWLLPGSGDFRGLERQVVRDGEGFKCVVGDLADPGVGEWLCGVLRDL